MKRWFTRFRKHPGSCTGHIFCTAATSSVGWELGVAGLASGWAYQFGSAWRKSDEPGGRVDTVGLDAFDYGVGYILGWFARPVVQPLVQSLLAAYSL